MRFKRIYVEITNCCNLTCEFCSPLLRPKGTMRPEQFQYILKQVKPFTNQVHLHVKGEPLMHPCLAQLLQICEQEGIKANITTNGTLLQKQREILLQSSALRQVNISLHSFSAGQKMDRKNYVTEAVSFAKIAARAKGKLVVLRLWNLDNNRRINNESKEVMAYIGQEFGAAHLESAMQAKRSVTLEKGVFLSWEEEFIWPSLKQPFQSNTGICYGMRNMIAILVDGTVVPCCMDGNGECSLGNVFYTPFAEIISSPRAQSMTENFRNWKVVEPLCQRCSYRLRFGTASSKHI